MDSISFGHGTHVGRVREHNEDNYLVSPEDGLWVVADGMGGYEAGEVASAIAVETIVSEVRRGASLVDAVRQAHLEILAAGETGEGSREMGCTVVVLRVHGNAYELAWVGDSRVYLYDGLLRLLTHDHSYVQQLIDGGIISEEEARTHPERSVITQALGSRNLKQLQVDTSSGILYHGDRLLLCSDGLTTEVDDGRIAAVLSRQRDEQETVDALIALANAEGGSDNTTVILVSAPDDAPTRKRRKTVPIGFDPYPTPTYRRRKAIPAVLSTLLAVVLLFGIALSIRGPGEVVNGPLPPPHNATVDSPNATADSPNATVDSPLKGTNDKTLAELLDETALDETAKDHSEPAQPPVPTKYPLTITTDPPDAQVQFVEHDAQYFPGILLEPGKYTIRVVKEGYQDGKEDIHIKDNAVGEHVHLVQSETSDIPLYPLTITTDPPNARVRIMNITPTYTDGILLEKGTYSIHVDATGYQESKFFIQITDQGVNEHVKLDKYPLHGVEEHVISVQTSVHTPSSSVVVETAHQKNYLVSLKTKPEDANVVLRLEGDDRTHPVSNFQGAWQLRVPPGNYSIEITYGGFDRKFKSTTRDIKVENRDIDLETIELVQIYRVEVAVQPSSAEVYLLDDKGSRKEKFHSESEGVFFLYLRSNQDSQEPYRIEVSSDGYETELQDVRVLKDNVTVPDVRLQEVYALNITTDPAGANIRLTRDNEPSFEYIPNMHLRAGEYKVEITLPGYNKKIYDIIVIDNSETTRSFSLDLITDPSTLEGDTLSYDPSRIKDSSEGASGVDDNVPDDSSQEVFQLNDTKDSEGAYIPNPQPGATWTEPITGMVFVWVPEGKYNMGSWRGADDCPGTYSKLNNQTVQINGFWIGKTEVTTQEWMKAEKGGTDHTANYLPKLVTRDEANAFINKLRHPHASFRLPTEAEWEYACRSGGEKERFCGGDDQGTFAWHTTNSQGVFHPVGRKSFNAFGLHDMSGNAWEWVDAGHRLYVSRGGSVHTTNVYSYCRHVSDDTWESGFRVVMEHPGQ